MPAEIQLKKIKKEAISIASFFILEERNIPDKDG
jgi:hypothetical protein